MKRWPAINPRDPIYQRDLASLQIRGTPTPSRQGLNHNHGGTGHQSH
jgi:hypothetical protein